MYCTFWNADDYQYETISTNDPKHNNAECVKIKDLIDIDLGCDGYGCSGEYVDEIWTNQNFGCVGFKQRDPLGNKHD